MSPFPFQVFCDTWGQTVNDLSRLAKQADAAANGRVAAEKQAYMSLPRPGVSGGALFPAAPLSRAAGPTTGPPTKLMENPYLAPPSLVGSSGPRLTVSSSSGRSQSGSSPSPRVRESQTVTHTFYSSTESLCSSGAGHEGGGADSTSDSAIGSQKGGVVLRQKGGTGADITENEERVEKREGSSRNRDFEYRMSVIIDELNSVSIQ